MDSELKSWNKILPKIESSIFTVTREKIEKVEPSGYDPRRKTFLTQGYACKVGIDPKRSGGIKRACSLEEEFEILKFLQKINEVPSPIQFISQESYEALIMERFPGRPVEDISLSNFELFIVVTKIFFSLLKISFQGISHNDLCYRNILYASDGKIMIIDFDQASKNNFTLALIKNLIGLDIGKTKTYASFVMIFKRLIKRMTPYFLVRKYRQLTYKHYYEDEIHELPKVDDKNDKKLKQLLEAWKIAQNSDASSPGVKRAYYAYDYEGLHFPGERDWSRRWYSLKGITNFSGKRIIELGCNMGLLGAYLMKEAKAAAVFGIDYDRSIIESAKIIDTVFEVEVEREVVNLDTDNDWEGTLNSFRPDIVFALNVLNWVENKNRLLEFLGGVEEVIFEGHDELEIEKKRLKKVGFKEIRVVGSSERKRPVLLCRKTN